MAGIEPAVAAALLRTPAAGHLVERHAPARYHIHDLLRLHAAGRAAEEDQHHQAIERSARLPAEVQGQAAAEVPHWSNLAVR
ncbi:hypothetical protein [Amycolatopsis sp. NPDC052450]|uniref:hypothetical protein n=1 Tax=Amycolatopsis sp. NPDC052450 TaxID=3363937 RepID=UPI0037CA8FC0